MTLLNNKRCIVVTGAGSGIGRAVALKLANHDWHVALVGCRAETLEATTLLAGTAGAVQPFPCDVADSMAVDEMASSVVTRFGRVDALVNAAGVNTPQRSLVILSHADFRRVIEINLYGAYYCTQVFLPAMRQQQEGTIVNISSEAGRQASAKAGSAYVISKFGLSGLTQSINAEERSAGIRACCIFLGDVATPLLDSEALAAAGRNSSSHVATR